MQKSYRPGAARRYAPADGSSTRGGSTSVRGRIRSPHTSKLQAASVPIAYGSCAMGQTDGQTDGSWHRLMPPYGGDITINSVRFMLK